MRRPLTEFERYLRTLIKIRGPLTMRSYMKECLTNPQHGYYMKKDVFGKRGDFTTAPEVSQMFGEIMGVWCTMAWHSMGSPSKVSLIETGPGRGTLMADLLRGTKVFKDFRKSLRVYMVEVSPTLRTLQQESLAAQSVDIDWVSKLEDVPRGDPTLVLSQELFDALPVHVFEYNSKRGGWCELMIDEEPIETNPFHFRFVISPAPTLASITYEKYLPELALEGMRAQICPEGMVLAQDIAKRLSEDGGASLIIDYGEDKYQEGRIIAISDHREEHLLKSPGEADISAWVDFSSLRTSVEEARLSNVRVLGPVSQHDFLRELGIDQRAETLLRSSKSDEEARNVVSSYDKLVNEMGKTYQVLGISSLPSIVPGFDSFLKRNNDNNT